MTVRELIAILEEQDPEAAVYLMTQESWPFENDVAGVTSREEIATQPEDPGVDLEEEDLEDESGALDRTDVFIVEGRQLRYGSKSAWAVARS